METATSINANANINTDILAAARRAYGEAIAGGVDDPERAAYAAAIAASAGEAEGYEGDRGAALAAVRAAASEY